MRDNPPPNISAAPDSDDKLLWKAIIKGPPDSPYEGGNFHLTIHLPQEYPNKPPVVKFHARVFHPNISTGSGTVCLYMLEREWSPEYKISGVLLAIYCLLTNPNPDDAFDDHMARLYKENRVEYNRRARLWTQRYAR